MAGATLADLVPSPMILHCIYRGRSLEEVWKAKFTKTKTQAHRLLRTILKSLLWGQPELSTYSLVKSRESREDGNDIARERRIDALTLASPQVSSLRDTTPAFPFPARRTRHPRANLRLQIPRRPDKMRRFTLTPASSLLLLFPAAINAYLGPTYCSTPGTTAAAAIQSTEKGYSTFNHLLFDMVSIGKSFQRGQTIPDERLTFSICPGTVLDLDDSSLPLGFLPIRVPRVTLQCGEDGRRGRSPSNQCVIRGGGKRNPNSDDWNVNPTMAFKASKSGIVGGGYQSVAQVYVYGETAYEVTLRGLTFDNSPTEKEKRMYNAYIAQYGEGSLLDDMEGDMNSREDVEQELLNGASGSRNLQTNFDLSSFGGSQPATEPTQVDLTAAEGAGGPEAEIMSATKGGDQGANDDSVFLEPAYRFASVAMRGKGYGDDAGPRLITIEDCHFTNHRGYAILVSPGIQEPQLPQAPKFEFMPPNGNTNHDTNEQAEAKAQAMTAENGGIQSVDAQSSGQLYNPASQRIDANQGQGSSRRILNLLDNGGKFIPSGGLVSYYDDNSARNYLDGRRVKIVGTEFINNQAWGENVAGLVTSAYSLTLSDCHFNNNNAKAMVFVYNDNALVENSVFAENKVEVSTVIMASPKGVSQKKDATSEPTHLIERSCFLGSNVGLANVLVTDVDNTGFGQRNNYARGTQFTWVSSCEGGAAEQLGNDCLKMARCDGTCVHFTESGCKADRAGNADQSAMFAEYLNSGRATKSSMFLHMLSSLVVLVMTKF